MTGPMAVRRGPGSIPQKTPCLNAGKGLAARATRVVTWPSEGFRTLPASLDCLKSLTIRRTGRPLNPEVDLCEFAARYHSRFSEGAEEGRLMPCKPRTGLLLRGSEPLLALPVQINWMRLFVRVEGFQHLDQFLSVLNAPLYRILVQERLVEVSMKRLG